MIAQQLAQDHPDMIRRVILLGAGPRGGEDMTFTELSVDELLDNPVTLLMAAFLTPGEGQPGRGASVY
jgi:pimeloyl-ACP methyl ester carboxylesterase